MPPRRHRVLALLAALAATTLTACRSRDTAAPSALKDDPTPPALVPGSLDVAWIHGAADCAQSTDPAIQVHKYEADTYILRQSKCLNYEGPFIYLLLGKTRALMLDSGATFSAAAFPIRKVVDGLVEEWAAANGGAQPELVVAHTHGHGDHVAGDAQFAGRPQTTVVKTGAANVHAFFGFSGPQGDAVPFDLGGRTLDVLPLPGHCPDHVAVYDRRTGLLLTGDTLYPGRLYVGDWTAFRASIKRLTEFAAPRAVAHVLGTHIEMTKTPGVDYPIGTTFQPEEHLLQLGKAHLEELNTALEAIGPTPQAQVRNSFIIAP